MSSYICNTVQCKQSKGVIVSITRDLNRRAGKPSLRTQPLCRDNMREKAHRYLGQQHSRKGQTSARALSGEHPGMLPEQHGVVVRTVTVSMGRSGASHLKLRGVSKALILFYWRLKTFTVPRGDRIRLTFSVLVSVWEKRPGKGPLK